MRYALALFLTIMSFVPASAFPPEDRVAALQGEIAGLPIGEKIARWAEAFVGTPYDPDPLGEYVTKKAVVADDRVDCMYHTFRSVELAMSNSPAEAVEVALDKRFKTRGAIEDGIVKNYDERFEYAMDMLLSGKWGREVTAELAATVEIQGARSTGPVAIIPASRIPGAEKGLRSGDVLYFVKEPGKRVIGEIIGHLGIAKREGSTVWLIHASGRKNGPGMVKKLPLSDYISSMPFIGIKVSRF
jgi:hypothetical protein